MSPHSHLLQSIQRTRRYEVRDPDTWEVVKQVTKDINVRGELFDIPLDCPARHRSLIPLKYFRNVDATPFLYDRFIGVWDQLPHHDQVTIYFSKNLYAKFVLHMRSDYIDTKSHYYGHILGHSYKHERLRRDPRHVPPPPRFFLLPSRSLVLLTKLKELSQLGGDTRETITDNIQMSLDNGHVALDGEINRPPPLPRDPPVPLCDDSFPVSLPFCQFLTYVCMYRDAIRQTWRVHDLRDIDHVHIYTKILTLIIKLCIIIYINLQFI